MKKFHLLLGFAAGFLLGSKAGKGPYETFESRLHAMVRRPEVRDAVVMARDQMSDIVDKVGERIPGMTESAA